MECLTETDQNPTMKDSYFFITYHDFYWTAFLMCQALPSACLNWQPPAQGLAASHSGLMSGDGASRGQHAVVPTLPLENIFPVT